MALELVAGHAVHNLGLANLTLVPRDDDDFIASTGTLKARDGPDTVNLFIDAADAEFNDYEYAASVVEACVSHTVYALRCTAGSADFCGGNVAAVTVTENASQYHVSTVAETRTAGVDVKVTAIEDCELAGKTAATCTATAVLSLSGQKTTATTVSAITDAASLRFDVSVTGGNEKLVSPTGKCSAASSVNTRAVALWGFLGALGAVSVLAF